MTNKSTGSGVSIGFPSPRIGRKNKLLLGSSRTELGTVLQFTSLTVSSDKEFGIR